MNPEIQLAIMAAFTGFLLKSALGFCVCWATGKVAGSPRIRFLIWFGFLVGADAIGSGWPAALCCTGRRFSSFRRSRADSERAGGYVAD